MAYTIITSKCVRCGNCRDECPGNSISKVNNRYEVNPGKCLNCGTCAFGCPVGAAIKAK